MAKSFNVSIEEKFYNSLNTLNRSLENLSKELVKIGGGVSELNSIINSGKLWDHFFDRREFKDISDKLNRLVGEAEKIRDAISSLPVKQERKGGKKKGDGGDFLSLFFQPPTSGGSSTPPPTSGGTPIAGMDFDDFEDRLERISSMIDVIGGRGWNVLRDLDRGFKDRMRQFKEIEKYLKNRLKPLKGSILDPLFWGALGAVIAGVLGTASRLLGKLESDLDFISDTSARSLAGEFEIMGEMVSKVFKGSSQFFEQMSYYFAQFGINLQTSAESISDLFDKLGVGVKEFLSSSAAKEMLGYFTLLGVRSDSLTPIFLRLRFVTGSVDEMRKSFVKASNTFLQASKKIGVSIQSLVETQERLLENVYDISVAYRFWSQAGGRFGGFVGELSQVVSVFVNNLRQKGINAVDELGGAFMAIGLGAGLTTEEFSKMLPVLSIMGNEVALTNVLLGKLMAQMLGIDTTFKDARELVKALTQRLSEMNEQQLLILSALPGFSGFLQLRALGKDLDEIVGNLDKIIERQEKVNSQIKRVDSMLDALKDKAKIMFARFFAYEGLNKIILEFIDAVDRAVKWVLEFLNEHKTIAKIIVYLIGISMVLWTVFLSLAPALLLLIPAFKLIQSVASRVFEGLESLVKKVFGIIYKSVGTIGSLIFGLIRIFDALFVFVQSFGGLFSALLPVIKILGSISLVVMLIASSLGLIPIIISGIIGLLGGLKAIFVEVFKENSELLKILQNMYAQIEGIFVRIANLAGYMWEKITNPDAVKDISFDALVKEIAESFKQLLKNLFPVLEYFGIVFFKGFAEGFKKAWSYLYEFIVHVDEAGKTGLQRLYERIKGFVAGIFGSDIVGDLFNQILQQFPQIAAGISRVIIDMLIDVIKVIVNIVPKLVDLLGGFLSSFIDSFIYLVISIGDNVGNIAQGLVKSLVKVIGVVLNFLVTDGLKALPKLVFGVLRIAKNLIVGLLEGIVDMLPELVSMAADAISGILSGLPSFFSEIFGNILTFLVSLVVDAMKLITKALARVGKVLAAVLIKGVKIVITGFLRYIETILSMIDSAYNKLLRPVLKFFGVSWADKELGLARFFREGVTEDVDRFFDNLYSDVAAGIDSILEKVIKGWEWGAQKADSWLRSSILSEEKEKKVVGKGEKGAGNGGQLPVAPGVGGSIGDIPGRGEREPTKQLNVIGPEYSVSTSSATGSIGDLISVNKIQVEILRNIDRQLSEIYRFLSQSLDKQGALKVVVVNASPTR